MNLLERIVAPTAEARAENVGIDYVLEFLRAAGSNPLPNGSTQIAPNFANLTALGLKGNGIVFGCMSARMLLFSEAEFKYQNLSTKKLFGSPELGLLERPWRNGTTGELLGLMELDASLAGNSFWTVATYPGTREDYLRRLRPDWVNLIREDSRVVGYSYHDGGFASGKDPETFTVDEVAHYSPLPDPLEPYKGMSWLTPILREIDADTGFTEHRHKSVDNAGAVPYAVTYPEMTAETFAKTITAFKAAHQGRKNAWQPLHLTGGADVKTLGMSMKDLDYKAVQGAGETRITVASRVPAVIAGISEGLAGSSLNQGNYGMARRQFGDGYAFPHWRMACGTLAQIVEVPTGARLWFDTSAVSFLREDQKDAAEISATEATAMRTLLDAGYKPESVTAAVTTGDMTLLEHSGLFSVQLQPPGTIAAPNDEPPSPPADDDEDG